MKGEMEEGPDLLEEGAVVGWGVVVEVELPEEVLEGGGWC